MLEPLCSVRAKSALVSMAFALVAVTFPATLRPALAGPGSCAANSHGSVMGAAHAADFAATQHTGCTAGVPSGDATACNRATFYPGDAMNFFRANWPSSSARVNDAVGGCSFMCTSGDCRVGNDGLPVELMHFGID